MHAELGHAGGQSWQKEIAYSDGLFRNSPAPKTKKRRLPEGKRRFFDHEIERGIALSLAGLAATYSPRA
jgi:hypothetical protein